MNFSIDTSFFIESWRRYPIDVFPSFWLHIGNHISQGNLLATEIVYDEIKYKDDDLIEWVDNYKNMFIDLDDSTLLKVTEILSKYPNIVEKGKERTQADVFVIALAMDKACTVVTEEKINKKNGIPMICGLYSVPSIDSVELMRKLNLRF